MSEFEMVEELTDLMSAWMVRGETPIAGGRIFAAAFFGGFLTAPPGQRLAYLKAGLYGAARML